MNGYFYIGRSTATSSVRFYCTDEGDKKNSHDTYQEDPWMKYRENLGPMFQLPSVLQACSTKQQQLTHVDHEGQARMVNVADKPWTVRRASAQATVWIGPEAFKLVSENQIKKGDVLKVAEIAGISGGKLTAQLIPLCHPIALHKLRLHLTLSSTDHSVLIESEAVTRGPTGVEMEALTAVSIASLTIIDMVKAVTKHAEIRSLHLVSKSGGTSGDFIRTKSS